MACDSRLGGWVESGPRCACAVLSSGCTCYTRMRGRLQRLHPRSTVPGAPHPGAPSPAGLHYCPSALLVPDNLSTLHRELLIIALHLVRPLGRAEP